ncbi:MAG: hypothetical protein K6G68_08555 [Oscillospiraceae bacterium]|nr:hypothetical protein [Oscillospiraceae bacterium]
MQKALDQEYEKFCAVFGDINTIRSIDIQAYKNDNVYGTFGKNNGILTLFGAGGDEGMAFLSLSAREHKRNGQWSTGSPMHAFRHELGHAWQQQLKTSDPQFDEKIERIKNKKAEFWERLTSSPNYDKLDIINAEQKKILSIYGLDREYDIDELISECAAEYVNGKPRDFAREVIEILKEK